MPDTPLLDSVRKEFDEEYDRQLFWCLLDALGGRVELNMAEVTRAVSKNRKIKKRWVDVNRGLEITID